MAAGIEGAMNGLTQGIIQGISGGDILQGISSGSISSLVSTAVGMGGTAAGVDGTKIGGTLFFGTVSGGFGAVLTNGNFWQGAATGLIVSGLNHVAHRESPDNGYEKDGKGGYRQINEEGGDSMDYLYENGTIIESKVPFQKGGEVSYSRTYGVLANTGTGGSLNDPSWDIFMSYVTGKGIGTLAKYGLPVVGKYVSVQSARIIRNNWKYLNNNNWLRIGKGSGIGESHIRISVGAHPKYLKQVPEKLRPLNQWLKKKIGNDGHIDFKNWKW
ncbi:MAG: hypothetical protein J6581_08410 [Apibacter sp.]|nr:hypothetical protein [Apibacter sp.]